MKSRCKFTVIEVTEFQPSGIFEAGEGEEMNRVGENRSQRIKLSAVHDPDTKEDRLYSQKSPSGSFEVTVTNQDMIDEFKPGESYYLDLTPCAE